MGQCFSQNIVQPSNNICEDTVSIITESPIEKEEIYIINDSNTMFLETTNNEYTIFYHPLHLKLPFDGWLHYCILCRNITGKVNYYSTINNKKINFQICSSCWKNRKNELYLQYLISTLNFNNKDNLINKKNDKFFI